MAPLRVASLLGFLLAVAALIFGASILWETLYLGESVPGYPSLVVGLMVLGGVQLIMIGIMGEYIGKILSEIKARPVYFVAEHSVPHGSADGPGMPTHDVRPRRDRRRMSARPSAPSSPIWLCADDYGISPAVNKAIRDLVAQRPPQRHLGDGGGAELRPRRGGGADDAQRRRRRVAIGLHVTLTGDVQADERRAFAPTRATARSCRSTRCCCAAALRSAQSRDA